ALQAGGKVHGIIPAALDRKEIGHKGLTTLEVVDSMHTRKARMAELSDGFIAMPGGIGTFEEIFEIWTWGQLGIHAKPLGFLNIAGFYDQLHAFLDHATDQGFMKPGHRSMAAMSNEADTLIDALAAWKPTEQAKWISAAQS
ncbi:MAG: TIGR00730 family Rossman fold protein, partial [Bosea sp. (in: a-proteobacteria)]